MLFIYGDQMPVRILEEIHSRKIQEKGQLSLVRRLTPGLEQKYAAWFDRWETVFAETVSIMERHIETAVRHNGRGASVRERSEGILKAAKEQTRQFVSQLNAVAKSSAAFRRREAAHIAVEHIVRESQTFLALSDGQLPAGVYAPAPSSVSAGPSPGASGKITIRKPPHPQTGIPELTSTLEGLWSSVSDHQVQPGRHSLPPLPYAYNALEPHIDEQTMRLHHDRHHRQYVEGLNRAESELAQARESGDFSLLKHWERELAFHGAGHFLHSIFWETMGPEQGGTPKGTVAGQIAADFGGFDAFRRHFSAAAERVEGNGWAMVVWNPATCRLDIVQAENHQNLSQWVVIPLLVLDVWEHAYYLKYQNRRDQYVLAWWNVVNWNMVNDRFAAARTLKLQ